MHSPSTGRRVPEDISLIASEQTFFSHYAVPPQTTISPDYAAMAVATADIIEARLDGQKAPVRTVLPYNLILRESVAAAPEVLNSAPGLRVNQTGRGFFAERLQIRLPLRDEFGRLLPGRQLRLGPFRAGRLREHVQPLFGPAEPFLPDDILHDRIGDFDQPQAFHIRHMQLHAVNVFTGEHAAGGPIVDRAKENPLEVAPVQLPRHCARIQVRRADHLERQRPADADVDLAELAELPVNG